MRQVFADTSFYLALLNPADRHHAQAVAASLDLSLRFVTSEYVLFEVADGLAKVKTRGKATIMLRQITEDEATRLIYRSDFLFRDALQLYTLRPDKEWSLTDCTSFVIMKQLGLTDALTADRHFSQAGFNPLFLTPP